MAGAYSAVAQFESGSSIQVCKIGNNEAMEFERIRSRGLFESLIQPAQDGRTPMIVDVVTILSLGLRWKYGRKSTVGFVSDLLSTAEARSAATICAIELAMVYMVGPAAVDKARQEADGSPLEEADPEGEHSSTSEGE